MFYLFILLSIYKVRPSENPAFSKGPLSQVNYPPVLDSNLIVCKYYVHV